ncbi:MAG: tetratricopeptide repeat protein [Firmicutes bacterium]|nr:tetratricopeptide repeat protein [Bacillota bacterium]
MKAKGKTTNIQSFAGKVVPFAREAGYYLQRGIFYCQKNKLDKAHLFLRRAVELEPDNPYNHYNLACLLIKLGRLQEANRIFEQLISDPEQPIPECFFLLAVNVGLLDDPEKACEYLRQYLQADPAGEMAYEARELLEALEGGRDWVRLPSYAERNLLLERVLRRSTKEELSSLYAHDSGFKCALSDGLYRGPDEFKEDILRFYGRLGDESSRKILRDFVKNPWVKERFRQLALLELKRLGVGGKVQVFAGGTLQDVDLDDYPVKAPVWRSEWQHVLDCVTKNMRQSKCYDEGFFADVQAIWLDFINTVYPSVPRISKVETWAAALEYSLARFHCVGLTQKDLALEYRVSQASISSKFREINAALDIDRKAYQNMLEYIKRER